MKTKSKVKSTKSKPLSAAEVGDYLAKIENHGCCLSAGILVTQLHRLRYPDTKIVCVIADSVRESGVQLSNGKAIAQAAHAVSKLKLEYAILAADQAKTYVKTVESMVDVPITTIILRARDCQELKHIELLALKERLFVVPFYDTDEKVFKSHQSVLTSIAIGPYSSDRFHNITDYLPLW